ncbi:MAG: SiaB family protein kinase [Bacteroidales bacterium]|nr:SiaB family protein kinase [Bacteroidales bacterium]
MTTINKKLSLGQSLFSEEIKISYKGPVDGKIITFLADYIHVVNVLSEKATKKLFKIFFELAENISNYSSEKIKLKSGKEVGAGTIILKETIKNFTLVTGNPIKNEHLIPVLENSKNINELDHEELREYKRNVRRDNLTEKQSPNIGLITVALTSGNPLDIEINPIDENTSYFSLAVKVDK